MLRALVLYHSLFGNTRSVATSLASGIQESGIQTDCRGIQEIDLNEIGNYDFIAIGGPTHMIGLSKDMKAFLKQLKQLDLQGKKGFAFDTRIESRMNSKRYLVLENSAARKIESAMKRTKIKMVRSRESALVNGREGPLDTGVEERFRQIGLDIGRDLVESNRPQD